MVVFNFFKNKSPHENQFKDEVMKIINDFNNELKSKNNQDYPPPFWFDIIVDRANYMKDDVEAYNISINEVESEWIYMHADEYKKKYDSQSNETVIDAMSLRIERFGFIYDTLLYFETKLCVKANDFKKSELIKKIYNEPSRWVNSSTQDNFTETLANLILRRFSASSSLYGAIKYALNIGLSNNEIKKLYNNFIFDSEKINGKNPFDKFGISEKEAHKIINSEIENFNEKYGVEMKTINENTISDHYTKISKRNLSMLSKLSIQKRYAVFTILCHIANYDGMSDDENLILQDILLELEIDVHEYNNWALNMKDNQAIDLLLDLNQEQKNELSRYIILVVGADAEFSSQEMIVVNEAVKELKLGDDILIQLTEKYW